jgi:site-specific recombinase XerD
LDHHDLARSTRRVYRASLASLVTGLGPATAVGELSGPLLAAWFRARHAAAAPATWNRELATLRAAVGWWRCCGWIAVDPTGDLVRRRERVDRTRALTRGQLEGLFARRDLALRERTLWRLPYEKRLAVELTVAPNRSGDGMRDGPAGDRPRPSFPWFGAYPPGLT